MKLKKLDTRPFYGGKHHDSFGKNTFQSVNPATMEVIAVVPDSDKQDVDAAIAAAQVAFREWCEIDAITKGHLINLIADSIEEHA